HVSVDGGDSNGSEARERRRERSAGAAAKARTSNARRDHAGNGNGVRSAEFIPHKLPQRFQTEIFGRRQRNKFRAPFKGGVEMTETGTIKVYPKARAATRMRN